MERHLLGPGLSCSECRLQQQQISPLEEYFVHLFYGGTIAEFFRNDWKQMIGEMMVPTNFDANGGFDVAAGLSWSECDLQLPDEGDNWVNDVEREATGVQGSGQVAEERRSSFNGVGNHMENVNEALMQPVDMLVSALGYDISMFTGAEDLLPPVPNDILDPVPNDSPNLSIIRDQMVTQPNPVLSEYSNGLVNGSIDGRQIGKLHLSSKEIAKGSDGTVVFEGIYDGRPVAVKRLLKTHLDVASKEKNYLTDSDSHPNIVRYYGFEEDQDFVYLALEHCTCSLYDLIHVYSKSKESNKNVELWKAMEESDSNVELWKANGYPSVHLLKLMRDIVSGLAHLHKLRIIHRDLKPQNVLIINGESFGAKISDMGISKHLAGDMSTLTHATGDGTSGWRAPEQIRCGPQTPAVDIFSSGIVLYFCITGGKHPFGDSFERDVNIVYDRKDLSLVKNIPEAVDLFSLLLDPNPANRPKAQDVSEHPLFWTSEKRLSFLLEASDHFDENRNLLNALESDARVALDGKWNKRMDAKLIKELLRHRRYNFKSVGDLVRAIRNTDHHHRKLVGEYPEGFENYFSSRFPKLLFEVYKFVYKHCKKEKRFRDYMKFPFIPL